MSVFLLVRYPRTEVCFRVSFSRLGAFWCLFCARIRGLVFRAGEKACFGGSLEREGVPVSFSRGGLC